jgi:hypothetical protein
MDLDQLPKEATSKFFFITANATYVFGLDHDGWVWSRPASETDADWRCLGRPEIEGE